MLGPRLGQQRLHGGHGAGLLSKASCANEVPDHGATSRLCLQLLSDLVADSLTDVVRTGVQVLERAPSLALRGVLGFS